MRHIETVAEAKKLLLIDLFDIMKKKGIPITDLNTNLLNSLVKDSDFMRCIDNFNLYIKENVENIII